jgi:hypothetical protein
VFHSNISVHDHATGPFAVFSFSPKSLINGGDGSCKGCGTGYCMLHLKEQMMRSSSPISLSMMFWPGVKVNPITLAEVYLLACWISISLAIPQQSEQNWLRHSLRWISIRLVDWHYVT